MPQVCPRCKAPVHGRNVRCAECGTALEVSRSIVTQAAAPPSQPRAVEAAAVSAPLFVDQPAAVAVAAVGIADPGPPAVLDPPPEPGRRAVIPPPRPTSSVSPLANGPGRATRVGATAPGPVDPPRVSSDPEPEPEPEPENELVMAAAHALAGQGLYEVAGDVRDWMARMLAGSGDELPPVPQPGPVAEWEPSGAVPHLPPPDPPLIFYPMLSNGDDDWSDESFPPIPAVRPMHGDSAEGPSATPSTTEAIGLLTEELTARAATLEGSCDAALDAAQHAPTARLEVLDELGEWVDAGPVPVAGWTLGRSSVPDGAAGAETLANEHVALWYDGATLMADDLGSVDGVYRRIAEPVPLEDGQRFRVGGQVLEFRQAEPPAPTANLASDERGMLWTREQEALGYVDLIRPNGQVGLRFPLTKRDVTVIGREGPTACIALVGDLGVSTFHSQIRVHGDELLLEDLKSRGGTFVQIQGPTALRAGDVLQAGKLLFRIAEV